VKDEKDEWFKCAFFILLLKSVSVESTIYNSKIWNTKLNKQNIYWLWWECKLYETYLIEENDREGESKGIAISKLKLLKVLCNKKSI
jgi:hypothetical protein